MANTTSNIIAIQPKAIVATKAIAIATLKMRARRGLTMANTTSNTIATLLATRIVATSTQLISTQLINIQIINIRTIPTIAIPTLIMSLVNTSTMVTVIRAMEVQLKASRLRPKKRQFNK